MFKGLGNLGSLLKQAQQIGGQMGQITEEMKKRRVTGTAGGGMVEIEVNGLMEVLRCRIDPQLFAQNDREMLEDLMSPPSTRRLPKENRCMPTRCGNLTGGLPLPGLTTRLESPLAKRRTSERRQGTTERGEANAWASRNRPTDWCTWHT